MKQTNKQTNKHKSLQFNEFSETFYHALLYLMTVIIYQVGFRFSIVFVLKYIYNMTYLNKACYECMNRQFT